MFSFLHFRFFFLISLSFSAFFLFLFYFFYASLIGLCFFVLSVSERERENGRRRTVFVSELKRIIIIMVMLKNRTFTNWALISLALRQNTPGELIGPEFCVWIFFFILFFWQRWTKQKTRSEKTKTNTTEEKNPTNKKMAVIWKLRKRQNDELFFVWVCSIFRFVSSRRRFPASISYRENNSKWTNVKTILIVLNRLSRA